MKIKPNKTTKYKAPNVRPVPPNSMPEDQMAEAPPPRPATPMPQRGGRGEAPWLAAGTHDKLRGSNIAELAKQKAQKAYQAQMAPPMPVAPEGAPVAADITTAPIAAVPGAAPVMPDQGSMVQQMARRLATARPVAANPMQQIYGVNPGAVNSVPEDYLMEIIRQRLGRGA